MENRIYIKGRKGNRARARGNQKEKEKSGKREKWKVERNCGSVCRFMRGCVDWMMHPADWRNVFFFFSFPKVLRSEWQSGKEDLSPCPRALYSLGLFLGFFAVLFTTTTTVWSLARLHSPYLTCHDVRPLPVSPLSCLMYHVELHTVAITKPSADWEQKSVRRMLPFVDG